MKLLRYVALSLLAAAVIGIAATQFLHRGGYDVAPGSQLDPPSAFTDGRPNLVGAMFYSAWCSACAVLDPKIREAVPEFDGRAVEFVKFDFTMGPQPAQMKMAEELGIEKVYEQHLGATGFMALIDRRNQNVVGILTMSDTPADIAARIEAAIAAASEPAAKPTELETALN